MAELTQISQFHQTWRSSSMPGLLHMEPTTVDSGFFPFCCAQLCNPHHWAGWLSSHNTQINAPCCQPSQLVFQRGLCTSRLLYFFFFFGQDLVFALCGQTADQRASLVGMLLPCWGRWQSSVRSSGLEGLTAQCPGGSWLFLKCFSFTNVYPLGLQRTVKCWPH